MAIAPLVVIKGRSGFYKHCHALVFSARTCAHPVLLHVFLPAYGKAFAGVGNIKLLFLYVDLIQHHKVVLVPVQYARQRSFCQIVEADTSAYRMQSQLFGRLAYAQQRYAF